MENSLKLAEHCPHRGENEIARGRAARRNPSESGNRVQTRWAVHKRPQAKECLEPGTTRSCDAQRRTKSSGKVFGRRRLRHLRAVSLGGGQRRREQLYVLGLDQPAI